ncbi:MAG: two-component sensor histidine kinase [Rhizobiaceae bacterium]|nr:two-component sensor histidine kinase [Rhizobiaceae bacterium]
MYDQSGIGCNSRRYVVASDKSGSFISSTLTMLGLAQDADERAVGGMIEKEAVKDVTGYDLASALDDPVLVIDEHANVRFANQSAMDAFGGFALGRSMFLRFRAPEIRELVDEVLKSRGSATGEYAERLPIERAYKVFASAVGKHADVFIVVFKDQSETRRIDRMRADFIANASHELRTPLASISGFIETLRGPARNDPKAQDAFLAIMQGQTSRMARLIDDLLSLSRLEMKSRIDLSHKVDLTALVKRVAESLAPLAQDLGVVIETDFSPQPLIVGGSLDELTQVFENLLENACKYGQKGKRVVVSARLVANEAEIAVQDYGPGIPEEHIPRVTERFYRVENEGIAPQKGTGLGLAIVKHILTRHGGRLAIQSEVGQGSRFIVYLPESSH